MKIAMLLPTLDKKGPIIVAKNIANGLLKSSKISNVKVFYFDDTKDTLTFNCDLEKLDFLKIYDFSDFDIVHSHTLRTDFYLLMSSFLPCNANVKFVTTIHQYNYDSFYYKYNSTIVAHVISSAWSLILSRHDLVVCLSKHMQNYYQNRMKNKNIEFVYNGCEILNSKESVIDNKILSFKAKYFIIGVACSLIKRKGLEQIIKSMPHLPNVAFVILGDGPEKSNLENLSLELGVNDRVYFKGFVDDVPQYYKTFDLFVFPSRSEGFGLALIEAAAMKIPIACSRIPSFIELFDDSEVGFFELDNIQSIVETINQVNSSREVYIKNSYSKYMKSYHVDKMVDFYIEKYLILNGV
ncbi:glycosyltransferase family 4 protein [Vibrio cholerae]